VTQINLHVLLRLYVLIQYMRRENNDDVKVDDNEEGEKENSSVSTGVNNVDNGDGDDSDDDSADIGTDDDKNNDSTTSDDDDDDNLETWVAIRISAHRRTRNGHLEFMTHWENFEGAPTWEPASSFGNGPLLQDYMRDHNLNTHKRRKQ
jgi:hypothetical protein